MIKNIAYFPSQCAKNSGPVMSAVLDYLQACGIETQENNWNSDAAVIWSVLWAGRMAANKAVYDHYRQQNKPVIVLEIGALYRGHTWKVAVNNITKHGYYGHENNLDMDRPCKLGISLAVNVGSRPEVVIALQHSQSLQVSDIDLGQWVKAQVNLVRQHSDRPIVIRTHPRNRIALPQLVKEIQIETPRPVANTYDSFDMHFNYHAVINYNSGPGIQAAIAGCRPIVDTSSLASPVGIQYNQIEQPYSIDRDLWFAQICHTEYTLEEIRRGIWLKRIEPVLQK